MSGYTGFRVSRLDQCAISITEQVAIENEIDNDIRFDYSEEEVDIGIDEYIREGVLDVCVYEISE